MISFKYYVEKNIGQDETVCYEEKYIMEMMKKREGKSGDWEVEVLVTKRYWRRWKSARGGRSWLWIRREDAEMGG